MYVPKAEVESVAASLIDDYGKDAALITRERIAWSDARHLHATAGAWQQVLECIELRSGED